MSVMLICTLGNRDVLLSGEPIKPPRDRGKDILKNFEEYKPLLTCPIIQPVLNYVFHDLGLQTIDRLVLVATDQDERTTMLEFRQNDTIEFAHILQTLLPRVIRKQHVGKKVSDIRIVKIPENPNYLDDMYMFFGKSLRQDKSFQMENLKVCYVEQTGGIPSANMALLFQCINKFKEKCCPIYVSEKTKAATPLKIVEHIIGGYRKLLLLHLISNYDYAALCDQLDEKKENEKFLFLLSQYAQHRLYFDTATAKSIATKGISEFLSPERNIFEDFLMDLEKIQKRDYESLLVELYHNMVVKYRRSEFVDFLGRLYRFQEALLRCVVERDLKISTEINAKTKLHDDFVKGVEARPDLKEFLSCERTPSGGPVNYMSIGVPVLMACLKYLIVKLNFSYRLVYDLLKQFDILTNLRNKSIIGHGFDGVSEKILNDNYDGSVLEGVKKILEEVEIKIPESPFDKINSILIQEINQVGSLF